LGFGVVVFTHVDDEGGEFVVAYANYSNNECKKYSMKGNAFVGVWAIVHLRCYLYGNPFILVTDHQPLKWLMESDGHSCYKNTTLRWCTMPRLLIKMQMG
jgi:hypothetical protein